MIAMFLSPATARGTVDGEAAPSAPRPRRRLDGVEWIRARLRESWSIRTSSLWSEDDPARGQCGVTALVVNDHLGGEILRTPIGRTWHFYNRVGNRTLDLTAEQFETPIVYLDVVSSRDEAFADTDEDQYRELALRFAEAIQRAGE